MGITIQSPAQITTGSVIQLSGLEALDNQINQLKTKAMQCINFFLSTNDTFCYRFISSGTHQVLGGVKKLLPHVI